MQLPFAISTIFQSTLPRGERPCSQSMSFHIQLFQSTLPRGERHSAACWSAFSANFNPRSREGSDGRSDTARTVYGEFQSTLPRGERHGSAAPVRNQHHISIHAPARGATRYQDISDTISDISIHAPARGATANWILVMIPRIFQSTLPRGERRPFFISLWTG